ncbi:hypothetical protein FQR65_LT01325 [Abscondita terminalis]|nr:hypothetical protein FQR65_LT01325 [Abscondita terminalis]
MQPNLGYYWRDFLGVTPDDAFVGGTDRHKRPVYVAQICGKRLTIGRIFDNKVTYELRGKEYSTTRFVKILCTLQPQRLQWLPTSVDRFDKENFVIGGCESGCATYVGRVKDYGEHFVGTVRIDVGQPGLLITKNGFSIKYTAFEILSFYTEYSKRSVVKQELDERPIKKEIITQTS